MSLGLVQQNGWASWVHKLFGEREKKECKTKKSNNLLLEAWLELLSLCFIAHHFQPWS